ncbi:MAG TPA: Ig-like domain-containing protein [Patescibacteria group bacterium]|nr:Ig-like domain-containing protein [Patescibacteria group bacterium]
MEVTQGRRYTRLFLFCIIAMSIVFIGILLIIFSLSKINPRVISTYPRQQETLTTYSKPFEIVFNTPIDMNKLIVNTSPETKGIWRKKTYASFIPFGRKVSFAPLSSYEENQKVMVYLSNISKPFSKKFGSEYLLEFYAPKNPVVIGISPPHGTKNVSITPDVSIMLSSYDTRSVSWDVDMSPLNSFNVMRRFDNVVRLLLEKPLQPDTQYTVTITKTPIIYEIKNNTTIKRGKKKETYTFSFRTTNTDSTYSFKPSETERHIVVSSSSPQDLEDEISVSSPIIITFDQEVATESAQSHFSISPYIDGSFSWIGKTMTFVPTSPFAFNIAYTAEVKKGVTSINGLDLNNDFRFQFKTAPKQFILDVPYHKQEENFTCNIAALRMLLSYRGTQIDEKTLKNDIGQSGSRGNGNPYEKYVKGYGVYWDPILMEAQKYRGSQLFKDWTIRDIIAEVRKNNPVMVWGQNGWSHPHEISWETPDGTYVYAINGMHSYVVKGYIGDAQNPTHIVVNDPWRGVKNLPIDQFIKLWNYFKVALVVY